MRRNQQAKEQRRQEAEERRRMGRRGGGADEGRGGGTSGGGGDAAKGSLRVREATFGFSLSMLSLMTALIVGVEARACMALGCSKSAWQVESRPAESSSDRMCASVGPESEHVGKRRDPGIDPTGNNQRTFLSRRRFLK